MQIQIQEPPPHTIAMKLRRYLSLALSLVGRVKRAALRDPSPAGLWAIGCDALALGRNRLLYGKWAVRSEELFRNARSAAWGLLSKLAVLLQRNAALSLRSRLPELATGDSPIVDIVVCVHNALDDVKLCLASVLEHCSARQSLIIVDDGSDADCRDYLQAFSRANDALLRRHPSARGYTKAANAGLRASSAPYVVLLNSDTIVTPDWIPSMLACMRSSSSIALVGPLSNAASWQSVPELLDAKGDWSVNHDPKGTTPNEMANIVRAASKHVYPRVSFLNGFCFMIDRRLIDTIGLMDEDAFPRGYGEENDYCLRAGNAGFELAVADQTYVFHSKSKSYTHEVRRELAEKAGKILQGKHGRLRVRIETTRMRLAQPLVQIRTRVRIGMARARLDQHLSGKPAARVLFVLPVRGGGGGAHSIIQEAHGMRSLGMDARVAIKGIHHAVYRDNYAALPGLEAILLPFDDEHELSRAAAGFDVLIGTMFSSMALVQRLSAKHAGLRAAYYVQDYEVLFFDKSNEHYHEALASYELIPDALLFAKTQWLRDQVFEHHARQVAKVRPSVDTSIYHTDPSARREPDRVRVVAMIRPSTPRRSPAMTLRVLERLAKEFGTRVDLQIFGATRSLMRSNGLYPSACIRQKGLLVREAVAELLQASDIFVDLSTYQAFGRTGLEAMACGCAVILPRRGGTDEYARHEGNSLLVDTSDEEACYQQLVRLTDDSSLRNKLRAQGLATAAPYSIEAAALSEAMVLADFIHD
ncbi:MAG: GT2 family glycosyltransferase [Planctomycetota bacterium]